MDLIKRKNLRAKKGKKFWARNLDATNFMEVMEKKHKEMNIEMNKKNLPKLKITIDNQTNNQQGDNKKLDEKRFYKKIDQSLYSKNETRKITKLAKNEALQAKLKESNQQGLEQSGQKHPKQKAEEMFDLWDDNGQNASENQSKPQIQQKSPYNEISSVVMPHPGQSYNPNQEDYENLLDSQLQAESKEARRSGLSKKNKSKEDQPRKLKRQRAKSQKQQLEFDMQKELKEKKQRSHQFNLIKQYQKEFKEQIQKTEEKKEKKMKIKEIEEKQNKIGIVNKPKRIGRVKYQMIGQDFVEENQIQDNIRKIQPTGNLLRDRFDTIFRKGIIAPLDKFRQLKKKAFPKYKVHRDWRDADEEQTAEQNKKKQQQTLTITK